MQFISTDKQAILRGGERIYSRIKVLDTNYIFSEDDYIGNWNYEDFRYVPDTGFLGQFVERIFDCELLGIPLECDLNNKTIELEIGVKATPASGINYYNYGRFIVTKCTYSDTDDKTKIECADFAKLFNDNFVNDDTLYPCTLLELANKVCTDVGVLLENTGDAYIYNVPKDTTLPIGEYCILVDNTYYVFTTTEILNPLDTLMLVIDENLVPINDRTIITPTTSVSLSGTQLTTRMCSYQAFTNNDFVLEGNPFEDTTNREVIKAIASTAFSWARINTNNKLVFDFTVKDTTDVDEYNEITIDHYEASNTGASKLEPVNKVGLGMKDVDGETVYATSSDYTEQTESTIYIFDNPITYNVEKRLLALAECDVLYGLTYTPMTLDTVGHIWLEGDDFVKLTNLDETVGYTYPFNRTYSYTGVIVSTLSSENGSKVSQNYEYKNDTGSMLRQTQFVVDKMNGTITSLVSDYNEIDGRVSRTEQSVDKINNIFQLQGGTNLIKNSAFLLTDATWEKTELDQNDNYITQFGSSYTTLYLGQVTSNAEIKMKNMKIESKNDLNNIVIASLNKAHTLSFKYKMDALTTATVRLINPSDNSVVWQTTLEPTGSITEIVAENITPTYSYLILEISTTTTNDGFLYLYDMLLNVGDKQTWSPASDEIYSTYIRLSQLGITILARGSDFATLMSSDEFAIYKATFNGEEVNLGEKITEFDVNGITTTDIKSKSVATGNYVIEDRNWSGVEHHIEYFKDEVIQNRSLRSLARQSYNPIYDNSNIITRSVSSVNKDETIVETKNYNADNEVISTTQIPVAYTSYAIIVDEDGEER